MVAAELEEHMLTTAAVAKWLGIAPRTVCTWAECNTLPGIKVGRQWRFRPTDLVIWLQQSQPNHSKTTPATAATAVGHQ